MAVNGWTLYAYPAFDLQFRRLADAADAAGKSDRSSSTGHPAVKLLSAVNKLILEIIPANPAAAHFRQGNTLGKHNRHWFRAKFHQRYRLFFRFSLKDQVIVYAWMNDEATLRKAGSKSDPYALFESMLVAGDPPTSLDQLIAASRKMP